MILDLGHSYRKLATLLDGRYWKWACVNADVVINPFALQPTPEHLHFLHAFVRVLLESEDTYRLSNAEDRELYEAIENLYVLDRTQRRLFTLRQPVASRTRRPPAQSGLKAADMRHSSTTVKTR